jgi:hypothetical protein
MDRDILQHHVILFLDVPNIFHSFSLVNKQWNSVVKDEVTWKHIAVSHWPSLKLQISVTSQNSDASDERPKKRARSNVDQKADAKTIVCDRYRRDCGLERTLNRLMRNYLESKSLSTLYHISNISSNLHGLKILYNQPIGNQEEDEDEDVEKVENELLKAMNESIVYNESEFTRHSHIVGTVVQTVSGYFLTPSLEIFNFNTTNSVDINNRSTIDLYITDIHIILSVDCIKKAVEQIKQLHSRIFSNVDQLKVPSVKNLFDWIMARIFFYDILDFIEYIVKGISEELEK